MLRQVITISEFQDNTSYLSDSLYCLISANDEQNNGQETAFGEVGLR